MTLAEARRRLVAPTPAALPFRASIDGPRMRRECVADLYEIDRMQTQLARATATIDEMALERALLLEARAAESGGQVTRV